ncbi:MAG: ABC transporter permease [Candidatus Pseudobacter hemicellulosilyticus]|uniref:ABC transporter permease n=1 Tax=Candidatus Pseudobacter hemicellulosilyticus TaxID=3121375 RepID=A0AAJ6BH79_9BACT|nr:MAG: ABC transporter permease [Pseudobacter sp.]
MFRNYLLVAVRSIYRNKLFTFINVIGLSIGITAALVIYLLVHHDYSFDNFHRDSDRIYRVVSQFEFSGERSYNPGVTVPLSRVVKEQVPGIEYTAPFFTLDSDTKISLDADKPIVHRNQANTIYVSPDYFRVFDYEWIAGNPSQALNNPYQAVLSETKASLYFPGKTPAQLVGERITINDSIHCSVSGVVRPLKGNTDLSFQVFISWATWKIPAHLENWQSTNSASQLLVKLHQGQNIPSLEKQLKQLFINNAPPDPNNKLTIAPFLLQPLKDLHFDERFGTYFDNRIASRTTLNGLLIVAGFILLLGCINFINLSTAQSAQRAKEIAVRKTMGSSKGQLIVQFLTETGILTLIAALLSVLMTPFVLKLLQDFVPAEISFQPLKQEYVLLFLVGIVCLVTLLAGFYPAWVLSAYKPVQAMKSKLNLPANASSGLSLRRILTVSQFTVAQFFILAVIMVSMQLRYTLSKDPGFKQDGIIYFQTNFNDTTKWKRTLLAQEIRAIPGVTLVSLSNNPVAANGTWSSIIAYKDGGKKTETNVQLKMVDTNYLKLYELKLLAGKNISVSDSIKEFIINETYAKLLGFSNPAEALGKELEWDGTRNVPITGVVADFHQQSLHNPIKPLAIANNPDNQRTINVALTNGSSWQPAIEKIRSAFKHLYPDDDFDYSFQDETIRKYYNNEIKTAFLVKCASVLTIIISCLGLLGLAIYSTIRRTKEIGIRKVLGASVPQIVQLMSKESMVLVAIAFIIAAPLAYFFIYAWLENFAYRVSLNWWMFALTFLLQALIAFITVGSQALRTAFINPATTLKTE